MCGAGTIPIEAALIARNIPPGLARNSRQPRAYSFERWPSHDHAAWIRIVENAREEIKENSSVNIVASDRDQGAIEATYANAERAGVAADLRISQRSVSAVEAIPGQGVLIFNPPYGKRVGEVKALRNLYASVGSIVRKNFPLWPVVLLSGNSVLDRQMGLELETIARTTNGGIPVRIVGSR